MQAKVGYRRLTQIINFRVYLIIDLNSMELKNTSFKPFKTYVNKTHVNSQLINEVHNVV